MTVDPVVGPGWTPGPTLSDGSAEGIDEATYSGVDSSIRRVHVFFLLF
jgi:hypothetical protein